MDNLEIVYFSILSYLLLLITDMNFYKIYDFYKI